jgi:hypothetical protein
LLEYYEVAENEFIDIIFENVDEIGKIKTNNDQHNEPKSEQEEKNNTVETNNKRKRKQKEKIMDHDRKSKI